MTIVWESSFVCCFIALQIFISILTKNNFSAFVFPDKENLHSKLFILIFLSTFDLTMIWTDFQKANNLNKLRIF